MKKKILHLTLERKYFDAIALGKKRVEFREVNNHWTNRFYDMKGNIIYFDEIHFRNGYTTDRPFMRVKLEKWNIIKRGNVRFYALPIKEILEIKNWKAPEITSASPTSKEGMELTLNPIPSQIDNKNNNGSGTKPSSRGI